MGRKGVAPAADPVQAGHAALKRGQWKQARDLFRAASGSGATAEALEGLGLAAWWLGDCEETLEARGRAFQVYQARGDRRGAARVATALALDHCTFTGQPAPARGWARRAERLLQNVRCPELSALRIAQSHLALVYDGDPDAAYRLAIEGRDLGHALENVNLEMLALAYAGVSQVFQGNVREGMRNLDEATVTAVSGEMDDLDARSTACCCLIRACEVTRDLDRAEQWCKELEAHTGKHAYRLLFHLCRTEYAGVLTLRGEWSEAEAILLEAIRTLERTHRASAVAAIDKLAHLRCRQGRVEEAARLYAQLDAPEFRSLAHEVRPVGLALLALEQDDAEGARTHLERYLRGQPEAALANAPAYELLARASARLGDVAGAERAARALRTIAEMTNTHSMRAVQRFADGLAAALTDASAARACFEDAVDLYERCEAAFDAARSRAELARALWKLERREVARREARRALAAFRELGAAAEVRRTGHLLQELESGAPDQAGDGLTQRQREILRFLAQGLSNARIATRLRISPHTVKRHVADILTRLDLPSRAAAAAHAARHGLLP